jgi:predicted RND superfamily exporter protein
VNASARRPWRALLVWALLVSAGAIALPHLHVASRYPNVFARGTGGSTNDDLRAVTEAVGADLAPLEIHLEALDERSRKPERLIAANVGLGEYLATLPETRLTLSASTLVGEWLRREPDVAMEVQRQALRTGGVGGRIGEAIGDPRVASWIRADRGSTRTLVLLAPSTYERRAEIFAWVEHYVRTVFPTYRVRLAGPAYLYHSAEREGVAGVWQGALLDVLLLVLTFALVFRRIGVAFSAVVVNAAPIVVLLGVMAILRIPWTLGLMGLPVIVFGLAVDDTIHLLWPARARPSAARFARSAKHSAAAVISTCALLAGSLGSLAASGFQVNHELGMLLPLGLGLALAAELTLLPALLRVTSSAPIASSRRSARPSR